MISVTLVVKNGEKYLSECLSALEAFDEIILLDNGSEDRTRKIAARYQNVKIVEHEFIGFGPLKNHAAGQASNEWILSIDCDEILSPELLSEIKGLDLDDNCIYRFARKSHFNGKWIKGCGWYPDKILRLYNKKKTAFNDNLVHESVMVKPGMQAKDLRENLIHYPYDGTGELLSKAQFYATLYARQYKGKKKSSPMKAIIRGKTAFLKSYILRKGFLDGYAGFLISFTQGLGAFLKYLMLYEANRGEENPPESPVSSNSGITHTQGK